MTARCQVTLAAGIALLLAGCDLLSEHAGIYRFDDQLTTSATVTAPSKPTSTDAAEPLVWEFSDQEVTWVSGRGMMGFRPPGQLVVKGDGKSPLILSPDDPEIDWALYESILIRMVVAGGKQIKLQLPQQEYVKDLAPPMEFRVYRFDLGLKAPSFKGRMIIEPTDSPNQVAAIDYIRLVPRQTRFRGPAGVQFVGKQSDFRNAVYTHTPSSINYEVGVPPGGKLRFGLGIAEAGESIDFRIRVDGDEPLFSRKVSDAEVWQDVEVDLSDHAGDEVKLTFETDESAGATGLWANPILISSVPVEKPNVIVYMIDTLRADHTSLYGYSRDTTPFLKKLGGQGVVFDDCHAQATWTKPSVASLLTSLHTVTHGIDEFIDTIPDGATTMAASLRKEGYVTASVIANPFPGRNTGLERGVDHLLEYPVVHGSRREAEGATDSAAINRVVMPWLKRHRDHPFFLYVHSTDPHAPYRPPAKEEAKFANPADSAAFDRDYNQLHETIRAYGGGAVFQRKDARAKGIDPDQWVSRAVDRYDAEAAFNDRNIEQLVDSLRELGVLDNTLIVVLSDHGEEFLEHGWTTHGHSLYQELTHTVCLMWNPKLITTPARIAEPVQLIDVMPTVLDLLGVQPTGVVQGQSLTPLIRGESFDRKGAVMASRLAQKASPPPGGGIPENRTNTIARLDANWKLIYREQGKQAGLNEVELYDRRQDPGDVANVAGQHPEVVQRLMADIRQWIDGQKQVRELLGPNRESTLDPATLERLRSLGYIGGSAPPSQEPNQ